MLPSSRSQFKRKVPSFFTNPIVIVAGIILLVWLTNVIFFTKSITQPPTPSSQPTPSKQIPTASASAPAGHNESRAHYHAAVFKALFEPSIIPKIQHPDDPKNPYKVFQDQCPVVKRYQNQTANDFKFVRCFPGGGFNNQRNIISTCMWLGHMFNRIVVIHPIKILPIHNPGYIPGPDALVRYDIIKGENLTIIREPITQFFDISSIPNLVSSISFEDYNQKKALLKADKRIGRELVRAQGEYLQNSHVHWMTYWNYTDEQEAALDPLRIEEFESYSTAVVSSPKKAKSRSFDLLIKSTGNSHFYESDFIKQGAFAFASKQERDCFRWLTALVAPLTEEIWSVAMEIVDRLGGPLNYTSFHIRRGDFVTSDKNLNRSHIPMKDVVDWANSQATLSLPRDWSPGQPATGRMLYSRRAFQGESIYIATDEANKEDFLRDFYAEWSGKTFSGLNISDITDRYVNRSNDFLGCVEQIVCALGRIFFYSGGSTFDYNIELLREQMITPMAGIQLIHKSLPDSFRSHQLIQDGHLISLAYTSKMCSDSGLYCEQALANHIK